ncbi:MAG: hypothetical protein K2M20_13015, partial [Lachnospiraceae bacterium]|nr:hypothetical protein [Lachnospiraceae bacterium]
MGKKRILAVLLAACMIVESTAVASASEAELPSARTVESEQETPMEDPAAGNEAQTPSVEDDAADTETETPVEGMPEDKAPQETPENPAEDAVEEPAEGTQQPPEETADGETEQEPGAEEEPADMPEEGIPGENMPEEGLPEESVPEEGDIAGVSETMSQTAPLADEEITQGGTDMKITDLKLRQEYGAIALVWAYGWNDASASQADATFDHCNVYRSDTENGSYDLIWETSDADYHYTYKDN